MDPFSIIGGILGAGGQIAGGFMGAEASSEANKTNQMINLLNWYQRSLEVAAQQDMAREVRVDQKKGSTDASGNMQYFDPQQGWVTVLSPEQRGLKQGQDREQERVLNSDLPAKRQAMFENIRQAMADRFMADGIRDEMGQQQEGVADTKARMRLSAKQGLDTQFDELESQVLNKAMRMGSSNISKIIEGLTKQRTESQGRAMLGADATGEQLNAQTNGNRRVQLANLYNMFATRGAQRPDVSYAAQNVTGSPNAMMQNMAQLATGGDSAAITAAGKKGGTYDYVQPDMGEANAWSTAGSSIADMFKNIGASKRSSLAKSDNGGF